MKRIRTTNDVTTVAERWWQQYEPTGWMTTSDGISTRDVYDRLMMLPCTAADADVAEIIGNAAWTSIGCSECNKKGVLIRIGGGLHFSYAWMCKECLVAALDLVQTKRRRKGQ